MVYDSRYIERRREEIDKSEWLDIYRALRVAGARRWDRIVELGSGDGSLLRFLRRRGYMNIVGYDLLHEDELVRRANLELEEPEYGDYCVSQHFLEHISQDRAVYLLYRCIVNGVASINIVPGHYSDDPTHKVNHYDYNMLHRMALSVREKLNNEGYASRSMYAYILPDTMSYFNPRVRDWIFILTTRYIHERRLYPFSVKLIKLLYKANRIMGRLRWV